MDCRPWRRRDCTDCRHWPHRDCRGYKDWPPRRGWPEPPPECAESHKPPRSHRRPPHRDCKDCTGYRGSPPHKDYRDLPHRGCRGSPPRRGCRASSPRRDCTGCRRSPPHRDYRGSSLRKDCRGCMPPGPWERPYALRQPCRRQPHRPRPPWGPWRSTSISVSWTSSDHSQTDAFGLLLLLWPRSHWALPNTPRPDALSLGLAGSSVESRRLTIP